MVIKMLILLDDERLYERHFSPSTFRNGTVEQRLAAFVTSDAGDDVTVVGGRLRPRAAKRVGNRAFE